MINQLNSNQIILLILDGWGHYTKYHGNAIKQANTPTLDYLWHNHPHALLNASEEHVGLPKKQVGNSEVGHTTIGAGRIINQALVRITQSIQNKSFFNNKILDNIYKTTNEQKKQLHLIGLCSNGGVHSHIDHLIALIEISKKYKKLNTCIHIITDGRDTKPKSIKIFIEYILKSIENTPNINICTISGRYYSMDRDCRWQRTEKAYKCLITNKIEKEYYDNVFKVINESYNNNIYDEFIRPKRIYKGKVENGDGIIFFNFRPDRMRQMLQAFYHKEFDGFKREEISNLNCITFTTYDAKLDTPVVFKKNSKNNFLGEIISQKNLKQFRLAETEKYAHVTYFFNGGREEPFPGEDRELIPSPQVKQYDKTPEMSASAITSKLIDLINKNKYSLIVANYANPDMIGHTGNLKATKNAIETIDNCLNKLLKNLIRKKITILITADHGNADTMLDKYNEICKSHSNNLVPFILINCEKIFNNSTHNNKILLKNKGSLADIAPTILDLLQINKPNEMNGQSLIN